MSKIIHNSKIGSVALVLAAIFPFFIAAALITTFSDYFSREAFWLADLMSVFSLLTVSFFLPESEKRRFSSRQSALGGSSLFVFLVVQGAIRSFQGDLEFTSGSLGGIAPLIGLVVAYAFYWIALRSLRGILKDR